jgi:tRNA splicing ligase
MTEKEIREHYGIDTDEAEEIMKKYGLIEENATKEDALKELEKWMNDDGGQESSGVLGEKT